MEQEQTETTIEVNDGSVAETNAPISAAFDAGANEPSSENIAEAEATTETEARKYADRFESPEEMEKSYLELEAKLREDGKLYDIPEDYDHETTFLEANIEIIDNEQGQESLKAFKAQAKEAGFTQKQFDAMVKMGGQWAMDQIQMFRPQVDQEAEFSKVQSEWKLDDAATAARIQELGRWANANLPRDAFYKPLYASAEGLKLLQQLSKQGRGPAPIESTGASGPSLTDIEMERKTIMADPDYFDNSPRRAALQKKVDELIAQEAKMKGR